MRAMAIKVQLKGHNKKKEPSFFGLSFCLLSGLSLPIYESQQEQVFYFFSYLFAFHIFQIKELAVLIPITKFLFVIHDQSREGTKDRNDTKGNRDRKQRAAPSTLLFERIYP